MQLFSCSVFSLLCSLHLISSGVSNKCNDKQYAWPMDKLELCCSKCQPGERMVRRSKTDCDIECIPCEGERFTDSYNVLLSCSVCELCDKPNQEYKSNCSATHNAVCKCKTGYRCTDASCSGCVLVPTTKKATLSASTAAARPGPSTTTPHPFKPIRDTAWFLGIIGLLCIGITLFVVAKIKPFLRWIKSKYGYILAENPQLHTEDEDVSRPVQEVCGKCENIIEICVKD